MQFMKRKNTFAMTFTLVDNKGKDLDMLDKIVSFIVKKDKDDSDLQAILPHIILENCQSNIVNFEYLPEETDIPEGEYYCAVRILDGRSCEEIWEDKITVGKGIYKNDNI